MRANALAPGAFDSEGASPNLWPTEEIKERIRQGIPLGRFATAQEISTHALYLLSPACTYLNYPASAKCSVCGTLGEGVPGCEARETVARGPRTPRTPHGLEQQMRLPTWTLSRAR